MEMVEMVVVVELMKMLGVVLVEFEVVYMSYFITTGTYGIVFLNLLEAILGSSSQLLQNIFG